MGDHLGHRMLMENLQPFQSQSSCVNDCECLKRRCKTISPLRDIEEPIGRNWPNKIFRHFICLNLKFGSKLLNDARTLSYI